MCKNFETTFNIAVLGMMKEFKETTTATAMGTSPNERTMAACVRALYNPWYV